MSDFTATVILVLCFYPLLPIIAGVMANEAKAKKNIVIGCTLPFTAQHDPRVQELCRRYKKQVTNSSFLILVFLLFIVS